MFASREKNAVTLLALACLATSAAWTMAADPAGDYTAVSDEYGMVLKTPQGQTILRYMSKRPQDTPLTANSVCCLFPLKTPAGEDVVDFAPADHPHHRGVFLAWHTIDGPMPADFWGWGEFAPTKDRVITNVELKTVAADADHAVLEARNNWVAEGTTLIEETTSISARQDQGVNVVDLDCRLLPKYDMVVKQSAFGGLCVKSRKESKAAYTNEQGPVALPAPHYLQPETNWPASAWYDYTIVSTNAKTLGTTVVDHPGNPPATWHNVEAIAMVNPCIVASGSMKLTAGQPLRLRYRLIVHDGPAPVELLHKLAGEFRSTDR